MVLITGANGQLGYDFQRLFTKLKVDFIATDYDTLDITSEQNISSFIADLKSKNIKLTHIINCAAYVDVDKSEKEIERCFLLNCDAPKFLAAAAKAEDAVFVTISTDFVFDGQKNSPYIESDRVNPLGTYGKSKVAMEETLKGFYEKTFIIRTSWLFGIANSNFNAKVIEWAKTKESLAIVDDQISSPTYSADLANYGWKLICSNKFGLYHLTNSGYCSKFDQAKFVLDYMNLKTQLNRAKSSDFNLPAKRPAFSKLDSSKVEAIIGEEISSWQSGIERFLVELKKSN